MRLTWDWPETDLRLTWDWPETDLRLTYEGKMKIQCLQQLCARRTDRRTEWHLGLLSEPKIPFLVLTRMSFHQSVFFSVSLWYLPLGSDCSDSLLSSGLGSQLPGDPWAGHTPLMSPIYESFSNPLLLTKTSHHASVSDHHTEAEGGIYLGVRDYLIF